MQMQFMQSILLEIEEWIIRDRSTEAKELAMLNFDKIMQSVYMLEGEQVKQLVYTSISRLGEKQKYIVDEHLKDMQNILANSKNDQQCVKSKLKTELNGIQVQIKLIQNVSRLFSIIFCQFDNFVFKSQHKLSLKQLIVENMSRLIFQKNNRQICTMIVDIISQLTKSQLRKDSVYEIIQLFSQISSVYQKNFDPKQIRNKLMFDLNPDANKEEEQNHLGTSFNSSSLENENSQKFQFIIIDKEKEDEQNQELIDISSVSNNIIIHDSDEESFIPFTDIPGEKKKHIKEEKEDLSQSWPLEPVLIKMYKKRVEFDCYQFLKTIKMKSVTEQIEEMEEYIHFSNLKADYYFPNHLIQISDIVNSILHQEGYKQALHNPIYGIFHAINLIDYQALDKITTFSLPQFMDQAIFRIKEAFKDYIAERMARLDQSQIEVITNQIKQSFSKQDIKLIQEIENEWLSRIIGIYQKVSTIIEKYYGASSQFEKDLEAAFSSHFGASDFFIDYLIEGFHSILMNKQYQSYMPQFCHFKNKTFAQKVKILLKLFYLLPSKDAFLKRYMAKLSVRLIGGEWSNLKKELHILAQFESIIFYCYKMKQMNIMIEDLKNSEILNNEFRMHLEEISSFPRKFKSVKTKKKLEEKKITSEIEIETSKIQKRNNSRSRSRSPKQRSELSDRENEKEREEKVSEKAREEEDEEEDNNNNNNKEKEMVIVCEKEKQIELEELNQSSSVELIKVEEDDEWIVGGEIEKNNSNKNSLKVQIEITVISKQNWMIQSDDQYKDITIPPSLFNYFNDFKTKFHKDFQKRKLILDHSLSYSKVSMIGRDLTFVVSTATMLILLEFNKNSFLSCQQIVESTKLSESLVWNKLNILLEKKILTQFCDITETIQEEGEHEVVVEEEEVEEKKRKNIVFFSVNLNLAFKHREVIIDCPALTFEYPPCINKILRDHNKINSQQDSQLQLKEDGQSIEQRKHLVRVNIIKVIKKNQSISQDNLIKEVIESFSAIKDIISFQPTETVLKEQIEECISTGYLKRSEEDQNNLNFIS